MAQSQGQAGPKRLHQLDSMRGLAALAVVVLHCVSIPSALDGTLADFVLRHTPVAMVIGAREAVLFFFILSGFVLCLPFCRGPVSYPQFLTKRIFRIYLPYYAAMVLAVTLALVTWRGGIPELGTWFNNTWTTPITPHLLAQHALLIGKFPTLTINPPVWTLVYEMRISLIFPLFAPLVVRGNWKALAGGALVACLIAAVTYRLLDSTKELHTVYNASFFVIGCLLAKHRALLAGWAGHLKKHVKLGVLLVAILLYTFRYWTQLPEPPAGYPTVAHWAGAAGASLFLILALASRAYSGFLKWRPVHFVGQISYSVYLVHFPILFALVNTFYQKLPMWTIWLLTISGTLLVASALYYAVEKPSISAGRYLAQRLFATPQRPRAEAETAPQSQQTN